MMMHIYFDASALLKRYANESGTDLLHEAFSIFPRQRMICCTLGILETISILVRKRNDGRLSNNGFRRAMTAFNNEVAINPDFLKATVDDNLIYSASSLIEQHNLNSTDTIVLRSALDIRDAFRQSGDDLALWTADQRLSRAAIAEGLTVFNPEIDSLARLHQLLDVSTSTPTQE